MQSEVESLILDYKRITDFLNRTGNNDMSEIHFLYFLFWIFAISSNLEVRGVYIVEELLPKHPLILKRLLIREDLFVIILLLLMLLINWRKTYFFNF